VPQANRREFLSLAAGAAAFAGSARAHGQIDSTFGGVPLGAQSYSFRDRSLDEAIAAMVEIGIGGCELWSNHIERGRVDPEAAAAPPVSGRRRRPDREKQRKWRETVSLEVFEKVGQQFHEAGITLRAYNYSFRDDFSDAEIGRGFEMAKALGAKAITASANVTTAKRVYPFAKKHQIRVGMHNHSHIRPNEFATPDDFATARKGMEDWIVMNLDIGHYVGAGFDPIEYIKQHHGDIVTLHIKDKTKEDENVVFGQGDTPINEVLQLVRDAKFGIPANIEYEYRGEDTVAEVRKCFKYCKDALLA